MFPEQQSGRLKLVEPMAACGRALAISRMHLAAQSE
jgi:hypothetical protein